MKTDVNSEGIRRMGGKRIGTKNVEVEDKSVSNVQCTLKSGNLVLFLE